MTDTLDMDARYSVSYMPGVAFYLLGYDTEYVEVQIPLCDHDESEHEEDCEYLTEYEEQERDDRVIAVMVGDDKQHNVDVGDLTKIEDDDYCSSCGQIGCTADGR